MNAVFSLLLRITAVPGLAVVLGAFFYSVFLLIQDFIWEFRIRKSIFWRSFLLMATVLVILTMMIVSIVAIAVGLDLMLC